MQTNSKAESLIRLGEMISYLEQQLRRSHITSQTPITGILLWGPPGCGKTSMATALTRQLGGAYFINNDMIMEALLKLWFEDMHTKIKNGGLSNTEKEEYFWRVRSMQVSDLNMLESEILQDLLKVLAIPPFSDTEFREFKKTSTEQTIMYSAISFLIFLARHRKINFIQETTGNSFSAKRVRDVFGDIHSILQVVYVSSLRTLYSRVSARTEQLMNAPREYINESYYKSYYNNIKLALQSGIFQEIIVTSNDASPAKTMLNLLKENGKSGYSMLASSTTDLNKMELAFIRRVLTALGLPASTLRDKKPLRAFFCTLSHSWTIE